MMTRNATVKMAKVSSMRSLDFARADAARAPDPEAALQPLVIASAGCTRTCSLTSEDCRMRFLSLCISLSLLFMSATLPTRAVSILSHLSGPS